MDSILNLTIIATLMILGVLNERLNKICAYMFEWLRYKRLLKVSRIVFCNKTRFLKITQEARQWYLDTRFECKINYNHSLSTSIFCKDSINSQFMYIIPRLLVRDFD